MFLFSIAFLLGNLCLQQWATLPSLAVTLVWLLLGGISSYAIKYFSQQEGRLPIYLLPIAFSLGLAWSAWYATWQLAWSLPHSLEGQSLRLSGTIASIPVTANRQSRILFAVYRFPRQQAAKPLLQLTWRQAPPHLFVGEQWHLTVRLKRLHAPQNPGTFDYEAFALQQGIRARGYVVAHQATNQRLGTCWYGYPVQRMRQHLIERIQAAAPASQTAKWLLALLVGWRQTVLPTEWEILRRTGTNHLMAIAGLHIGLIASLMQRGVAWLWRQSTYLALWMPTPVASQYGGLVAACLYSALAGFPLPTERACLMLIIGSIALACRRPLLSWQNWSLTLLLVLLLNPCSVLSESFWLSFGTIALIIYGTAGRHEGWRKWMAIQWTISLGLLPLTLYFYQEASLLSWIANSLAVPFLALIILPGCFLSLITLISLPWLGKGLLYLVDQGLALLWWGLSYLSHLPYATWQQAIPSPLILCLAILGVCLLLLPAGLSGRGFGICCLLPLIGYSFPHPRTGEVWFSLLDVGQGLAAVLQTQSHILVYDTGPRWGNFDSGRNIVVPYLHLQGIRRIDTLVISHPDNDHLGGAKAIEEQFPIASIKINDPSLLSTPATSRCLSGETWQWDGVQFRFLHPTGTPTASGNNDSCVLRVDNGWHTLLLTGDIERMAEKQLLTRENHLLGAELLVAPHHGSQTSGLQAFVTAVHPRIVLYAVGYRNAYHFPHPSVMTRYHTIGARQFSTAIHGTLSWHISRVLSQPILYRQRHAHYWWDPLYPSSFKR